MVALDLLRGFVADARVLTVLVLIAAQVALALVLALKEGKFDPALLADWYRTRVLPYLGGTLVVYFTVRFLPTESLGPYGAYLNEGLFTVCWLTLLWTLLAKFWATLKALGFALGEGPPEPAPFKPG